MANSKTGRHHPIIRDIEIDDNNGNFIDYDKLLKRVNNDMITHNDAEVGIYFKTLLKSICDEINESFTNYLGLNHE
jgi:hypothetical protein